MKAPILLFHSVNLKWDEFTEPLHPHTFEAIIILLKRKYQIRPISDLLLSENKKNLKGSCFITFDDGLLDFHQFAYPIIKKHKVHVSMFLPTACIDSKLPTWNLQVFSMFSHSTIRYLKLAIENEILNLELTTNHKKKLAAHKIINKLILLPYSRIVKIMSNLQQKLQPLTTTNYSVLKWDDILSIHKDGLVSFYSHTANHCYLPSESDNIINKEFSFSTNQLQQKINQNEKFIAYPIGGYNEKILNIAKEYYDLGFSVDEKQINLNLMSNNLYRFKIPRFNIVDKSVEETAFRINGFHSFITRFSKRKHVIIKTP